MSIENSSTFGNYFIHGIEEIVVPDPVSWWPTTIGWKVLGIVLLTYISLLLYRRGQRWWKNRYRRIALNQLDQLSVAQQLAALPRFLKMTALQAYPREQVAALSGEAWLAFLDEHCPGSTFSSAQGSLLLAVAYLPEAQWQINDQQARQLIDVSRRWMLQHV